MAMLRGSCVERLLPSWVLSGPCGSADPTTARAHRPLDARQSRGWLAVVREPRVGGRKNRRAPPEQAGARLVLPAACTSQWPTRCPLSAVFLQRSSSRGVVLPGRKSEVLPQSPCAPPHGPFLPSAELWEGGCLPAFLLAGPARPPSASWALGNASARPVSWAPRRLKGGSSGFPAGGLLQRTSPRPWHPLHRARCRLGRCLMPHQKKPLLPGRLCVWVSGTAGSSPAACSLRGWKGPPSLCWLWCGRSQASRASLPRSSEPSERRSGAL